MSTEVQRKLTTIMAADAAGFSRAVASNEVETLTALRAARAVFTRLIERHHGRIANTAGDGLIAEFPSVVEAVQCAVEVQQELGASATRKDLRFRIGIHLGDVIVDGQDLLGEAVNLAARLEAMADPGAVLISQQVYDQVHAKLSVGFAYLGEKRPRNLAQDVSVYQVTSGTGGGGFMGFGRTEASKPAHRGHPRPGTPDESAPAWLKRRAGKAAVLIGALLIVDIVTGGSIWVHWVALPVVTLLAYQAVPLFVDPASSSLIWRGCVLVAALTVVNLLTWSGSFWVLWPAGALLTLWLLTRRGKGA